MKTTERFEKAVTKLYNAFHEGTLNGYDCKACAVGNILGHDQWLGEIDWWHPIKVQKDLNNTGYSELQLARVEYLFMTELSFNPTKEEEFKGLCEVVKYLCELDGIPNVMDYSSLFEYNDNGAKNKLQTVFG